MNPITALEIAADVAGRQNPVTTIQDAQTLYGVYSAVKTAGKLDISVMVKDGTLKSVLAAVNRSSALLSVVLADPTQGPELVSLLESVL